MQRRRKELGLPDMPFGPPRSGRNVPVVLNSTASTKTREG
jgi:hypothetical protein